MRERDARFAAGGGSSPVRAPFEADDRDAAEASPTAGNRTSTVDAQSGRSNGRPDEVRSRFVEAANHVGASLFRDVRGIDADRNVVVSPLSIAIGLAMLYSGARGVTRTEMAEALGFPEDEETLEEAFGAILSALEMRPEAIEPNGRSNDAGGPLPLRLDFVNAAWAQRGFPFRDAYLEVIASVYGAELREADFSANPRDVRAEINTWVRERSGGRIDEILPPESPGKDTRLVLTNAAYLRANWDDPFDPDNTTSETFSTLDGRSADVAMMSHFGYLPYAEVDGVQAVDLPYVGREVSLLVILPPAGAFEDVELAIDNAYLDELVDALDSREGTVGLPQFGFSSGFTLRSCLESRGITSAFDEESANLSGIAAIDDDGPNLFLDQVFHHADITVDEEGTEAAAATAVMIEADIAAMPTDPFEFVADRPFLFAIRDRPTRTVLFLGRVIDPRQG